MNLDKAPLGIVLTAVVILSVFGGIMYLSGDNTYEQKTYNFDERDRVFDCVIGANDTVLSCKYLDDGSSIDWLPALR